MRDARAINALAYETRVGSPLDFQPKRVSAPSCFRALRLECESRSSRKRKKSLGKCFQTTQKRQQLPGNYTAFVVKNSKNENKRRVIYSSNVSEALRQCSADAVFPKLCSFALLKLLL